MPHTTPKPPPGGADPVATRSLTRLEAHAAVRLDAVDAKLYDRHGLPLRRTGKTGRHGFSLMKSVKGLASYLTTRINPSFQECLIRVVEYESDLAFEVRQLISGKGARGRLVFTASLSSLVDVVSDSVIERDTVVFAHLPSSYEPPAEGSTLAAPVEPVPGRQAPTPVSKKGELISTLFSAYGDIGLHLVFRAALTDSERGHRLAAAASTADGGGGPLTRVGLRFVSAEERNEWMSFCAEAYVGLLLDSIRTDRDTVFVRSDGDRSAAAVDAGGADARVEKPSEEAVESYIDFFLSASARADGGGGRDEKEVDPLVAPLGGVLKVRDASGALHSREVSMERVHEVDSAGLPVSCGVLVFRRKRWSGKYEVQRIELNNLSVYADDDVTGSAFYLEFPYTATLERTLLGEQLSAVSAVQRSFLAPVGVAAAAGDCVTVECDAGSFSRRRQWLQWLEAVTKRPVLYLSVARREAEAPAAAEQGLPVGLLGNRTAW